MNGTKPRESLSSDCIVKCMLAAYANNGDALAVQINLDAIREGHYGLVVVPWLRCHWLLRDDFAVESPRSGEPIDDKCALDAFGAVKVAGYEVLGWQPYREETSPFMDRAGNTLPFRERPPRKSPEELGETVEESTISDLRKQNLELKKRVKQQEIEELRLCMRRSNEVQHLRKAASRSADQLQRSGKIVLENVKELTFLHKKVKGWEVVYNLGKKDQHSAESHAAADNKKPQDLKNKILRLREFASSELLEGLLNNMPLSAEKRTSNYLELKAAMLERKLDLANALRDSDHLHECYD
ncbi:hypothetical protein DER44DRAFT_752660 [Fusarium oxysporum]|nr:hypothetical protein DER44DRAFT_752660 [Fusarium oxysporum]